MDFVYSKLFLAFGLDREDNNKIHIDVKPFVEDPEVLAELFTALADTVISQLPESEQNDYETQFMLKFSDAMRDRHEFLDIKRTDI